MIIPNLAKATVSLLVLSVVAACAPHAGTPGDAAYRNPVTGDAAKHIPGGGAGAEAISGERY